MQPKYKVYRFSADWQPFNMDHKFCVVAPFNMDAMVVLERAKAYIKATYQYFYSTLLGAEVDLFDISVSDSVSSTFNPKTFDYLLVLENTRDGLQVREIDKDLAKIYFQQDSSGSMVPSSPPKNP